MHQQHTIKWLIFFVTILDYSQCFKVFIKKTNNELDTNIEKFTVSRNKPYEMPLFQTRYITMHVRSEDLHLVRTRDNIRIVGFKIEARSSNTRILNIKKEDVGPSMSRNKENITDIPFESLFTWRKQNPSLHSSDAHPSTELIRFDHATAFDIIWSIKGRRMDLTNITFNLDILYNDDSVSSYTWPFKVLVTQPRRGIDTAFYILLPFLVIFISVQMGILLDTKILADLVINPKPVIVGFVSQFGLMPFLAMGIAKIFHYSPLYSLSLFVIGCCPGSGASNQWTILFDGDVNLSALMSFVSTASSFFMMPLYFYTIGRIYTVELAIHVPFLGLLRSLALVVIPYSIGIGISHWSPRTRKFVKSLVKPMMIFLLLFFLVFGTIVNWYLIVTIDIYTALTAPLLPYLGFVLGGVIAWICRLNWTHIKTVGIEAGIQNTGIAFMIMFYSFPQPYATKAIVVPLVVAFLTTKPFWVIYVIRNRVLKYQKAKKAKENEIEETEKIEVNNKEKPTLDAEKPLANNEQENKNEAIVELMENLSI